MSRRSRKTGFPVFYFILSTFIIVFLIALFFVCQNIKDRLADYENSLPKYVAADVFEEYFSGIDSSDREKILKLISVSGIGTSIYENSEKLAEYLSLSAAGKNFSYTEASAGMDAGKLKYNVRISDSDGSTKFAAFTLTPNGFFSKYGSPLYMLESIELFCTPHESSTIVAPSDYTVYLNGIAVDDNLITETTVHDGYLPDGVVPITFVSRTVDGLYLSPEITVIAPDGRYAPVTTESGISTAELLYSDSLSTEFSDYVLTAVKTYSSYMQKDASFTACSKYFEKGTDLYEAIRTSATYWAINHDSFSFEDESASEFYAYDSNTFSCRVKLVHVLKNSGQEDFRDYIDMTLFFRRADENSSYLIFDQTNN